jgi:tetratricopeptide (TPR) repeat protein
MQANRPPQASSLPVDQCLKIGLALLYENKAWEALLLFKKALEKDSANPFYLSYYGLCMAQVEKNATKALPFCQRAIQKNFIRPELYCNLGKVYLLKGDRRRAHQAFKKGLSIDKANAELLKELRKMGARSRPVFPFLSRKNVFNHLAGFLRCKMSGVS